MSNERVVGGGSTYSKGAYTHLEHWPTTLSGGRGCFVYGKGTREWIDFTASLGAVIDSYTPGEWKPVIPALPAPSPLEGAVAGLLQRQVPQLERVRFCKNGSDATEGAVRVARHHTNKRMILTNSYHGSHSDLVTATGGKAGGILPDCWEYVQWIESPRQLLEYLTRWGKEEVAAVLLEPLTPSCQDWQLQEVQEECKKRGALLVLDEIITGWRVREGSAVPSIKADLYCFGKAIGGGWPLACLGGKEEYMNHLLERVFMSGTHAGEQASLQAASFLLQQIHDTPDFYPFIQQWGCQLGLELEGIVRGYPQRWQLTLPQEEHYRFIDTLAREGILVGRDVFPLYSHSRLPDREAVLTIFEKAREEACP